MEDGGLEDVQTGHVAEHRARGVKPVFRFMGQNLLVHACEKFGDGTWLQQKKQEHGDPNPFSVTPNASLRS